ncbi:MAG: hypothetical protein Q9225_002551 [Loekoesia sp. 1 TL-2023]
MASELGSQDNKKRKYQDLEDPAVAGQLDREEHPNIRRAISPKSRLPIERAVPKDTSHLLRPYRYRRVVWPKHIQGLINIKDAILHADRLQYLHHLATTLKPIPLDQRWHLHIGEEFAYSTDHEAHQSNPQNPSVINSAFRANICQLGSQGNLFNPSTFQQATNLQPGPQRNVFNPSPLALAHLTPLSMPKHLSKKVEAIKRGGYSTRPNALAKPRATVKDPKHANPSRGSALGGQPNVAVPSMAAAPTQGQDRSYETPPGYQAPRTHSAMPTLLASEGDHPYGTRPANQAYTTHLPAPTAIATGEAHPHGSTSRYEAYLAHASSTTITAHAQTHDYGSPPVPEARPLQQPRAWYDEDAGTSILPLPTRSQLITSDPRSPLNRNPMNDLPANLSAVFPLPEPSLNRYRLPSLASLNLPGGPAPRILAPPNPQPVDLDNAVRQIITYRNFGLSFDAISEKLSHIGFAGVLDEELVQRLWEENHAKEEFSSSGEIAQEKLRTFEVGDEGYAEGRS